jgi:hypothetical protein
MVCRRKENTMTGEAAGQQVGEVSTAVTEWLQDVSRLLQCVQIVVEHAQPLDDAPAEVRGLIPLLPPLIRQCRAQVPTDEMVQAWLRFLAAESAESAMMPVGLGND